MRDSRTLRVEYLDHYPRENGFKPLAYAKRGDAGFDLIAAIDSPRIIHPGNRIIVPCGVRFEIPYGYEVQIRSRSGLAANHGIIVLNAPGTVDSGYRGEICAILHNTDPHAPYTIIRGERIAQAILAQVTTAIFEEGHVDLNTERAAGGFGSSGR